MFTWLWEQTEWHSLDVRHLVPLESNRWYHVEVRVTRQEADLQWASHEYRVEVFLDGVSVYDKVIEFEAGDLFLRGAYLYTSWWGTPIYQLDNYTTPSVWWDEVMIDPPPPAELQRLYQTVFQQGLGNYPDTQATWFDYSSGYDDTGLLHVGANNGTKSLLRFDTASIYTDAVVDEATLRLYYTGRSNGNTLTLGAHRVLLEWTDSEANRVQRQTGVNWNVAGMGSGSDYAASAEDTASITGSGGEWIELDVTAAAQAWLADPANNHGLVLLQDAASGYVTYDFCSELGWSPCGETHAPRLTLRYHLPPAPTKVTFQQGTGGYSGNSATYFDQASGYNSSPYLAAGADGAIKSLLRFDVTSISSSASVDQAMLRVYYIGQSNGNSLTLGAHQVVENWTDSQANWTQRQTGVNWNTAGMGAGSDYAAASDGAADGVPDVAGGAGFWVELDVTDMVRAWVDDPTSNQGLVLLQEAASGYVTYDYCSELGWSPCTASQAPELTVWYRP